MNRSYLQGTPWHEEKIKRSCKEGSKHCLYNKNICTCIPSRYYHKKCVGKGDCEEFESKGDTAKIISSNTTKMIQEQNYTSKKEKRNMTSNEKHKKFREKAESRVNDVILKIENLENLSQTNTYEYTEEEVNSMFSAIQKSLDEVRSSFTNKNKTRFKF